MPARIDAAALTAAADIFKFRTLGKRLITAQWPTSRSRPATDGTDADSPRCVKVQQVHQRVLFAGTLSMAGSFRPNFHESSESLDADIGRAGPRFACARLLITADT